MTEDISTILVPVDFSQYAERAFWYAAKLAQRVGARLEVIHVVEDPFATGAWNTEMYVPAVPELIRNLAEDADRRMTTLKDGAAALGVAASTGVIAGRPAQAIVERAKAGGFDLIVMGTHGRTGLSHVVMGSVAERVMRKAPCPVLTIPARAAHADSDTVAA